MGSKRDQTAFVIGWGSHGSAWSQCLRASGWDVEIFLSRRGPSFERAAQAGFTPRILAELPEAAAKHPHPGFLPIAMLCPDDQIGPVYGDYLARVDRPLVAMLAHGYAVYAKELAPAREDHEVALLAPKAIGPKLLAAGLEAHRLRETHPLKAGFFAKKAEAEVRAVASAMGFAPDNLVPASFEQEAIGDLISEQGLLCGGVFNLLEWTMDAMARAGVPEALIREECLTELELIAGLIREKGPAATFGKISQAAQCGTIAMRERLEAAGVREALDAQAETVVNGKFVDKFRDPRWRDQAARLKERLEIWERKLGKTP